MLICEIRNFLTKYLYLPAQLSYATTSRLNNLKPRRRINAYPLCVWKTGVHANWWQPEPVQLVHSDRFHCVYSFVQQSSLPHSSFTLNVYSMLHEHLPATDYSTHQLSRHRTTTSICMNLKPQSLRPNDASVSPCREDRHSQHVMRASSSSWCTLILSTACIVLSSEFITIHSFTFKCTVYSTNIYRHRPLHSPAQPSLHHHSRLNNLKPQAPHQTSHPLRSVLEDKRSYR